MICSLLSATIALAVHCAPIPDVQGKVTYYVEKAGYRPNAEAIQAIVKASETFNVSPTSLARIAILESSFNPTQKPHNNQDGTRDFGMFQINEVNRYGVCNGFDIETIEGNAMCAAKIISELKAKWSYRDPRWIARYHSKTPVFKHEYYRRFASL